VVSEWNFYHLTRNPNKANGNCFHRCSHVFSITRRFFSVILSRGVWLSQFCRGVWLSQFCRGVWLSQFCRVAVTDCHKLHDCKQEKFVLTVLGMGSAVSRCLVCWLSRRLCRDPVLCPSLSSWWLWQSMALPGFYTQCSNLASSTIGAPLMANMPAIAYQVLPKSRVTSSSLIWSIKTLFPVSAHCPTCEAALAH
jgi:hypothetical protein